MPDPLCPLAGRRILVVEDEYLIAMEIKRWLQIAGAEVVGPAPGVDEALMLIEADGLDAAVLDVNLGEGDTAYPIADRLRADGIPHLFATGDAKVVVASVYGSHPRLEKPFLEQELVRTLADLLS